MLSGSVFTDRGVYRERDTVRFKAIVRDDTTTSKALLPPETALEVARYSMVAVARSIDARSV